MILHKNINKSNKMNNNNFHKLIIYNKFNKLI